MLLGLKKHVQYHYSTRKPNPCPWQAHTESVAQYCMAGGPCRSSNWRRTKRTSAPSRPLRVARVCEYSIHAMRVTRPLLPPSLSPPVCFTLGKVQHWHHHVRSSLFVADLSPMMRKLSILQGWRKARTIAPQMMSSIAYRVRVRIALCINTVYHHAFAKPHGLCGPGCTRVDGGPGFPCTLYLLHSRR